MPAKPVAAKKVTRGPQIGAPPSLEQVAVERLQVDPTYQRLTSGNRSCALIVGMIVEWDWRLALPLLVARRIDGGLFIIDGQHRHAGATERADIAFMPCVILPAGDLADEARTFVAINDKRQALSQTDKFAAMLVAGDGDAAATAALIEETGWRVVRGNFNGLGEAGKLTCAPLLVRLRKKFGEHVLRLALLTVREAWPDTPIGPVARMTEALCGLYRNRDGGRNALVVALSRVEPKQWMTRAGAIRDRSFGLSELDALSAAFREALPKTAGGQSAKPGADGAARVAPPPVAPPPVSPRPAPRPVARIAAIDPGIFSRETGKAWCDQCEQQRSQRQVETCASSFCTIKRLHRSGAEAVPA